MAAYKIEATIYVDWHCIRSKQDAIDEIQQMLDSYYYDNKSDPGDILIKRHSIKRITKKESRGAYGL